MRRVTTHVYGDETGGQVAVVEVHEVEGDEMPRHVHANEDELVYVLAGVVKVRLGDTLQRLEPGASRLLRRGIEHGYTIESREVHLLIVLLPAGSELFFHEQRASRTTDGVEGLIAVAARYGIAITGPPRSTKA
jgi:quercetin dioxygenase-like cupin family protein